MSLLCHTADKAAAPVYLVTRLQSSLVFVQDVLENDVASLHDRAGGQDNLTFSKRPGDVGPGPDEDEARA